MEISLEAWNEFLKAHAGVHFLQSGEWGQLKAAFGWKAIRLVCGSAGAQILFRTLPGGFSVAYLPKGPVGYSTDLAAEIEDVCRRNRAIFLKIEPDAWEPDLFPGLFEACQPAKPVQPRRTVVVSLEGSEEDILARMKQKTRYNIRLAEKKEVVVTPSTDVGVFHELSLLTAQRDKFGVHSRAYYQKVYDLFHPGGHCELLTASYAGQPLAALFVFAFGEHAYYLYGASSDLERNRMPAYLIQWEAMRWAKSNGCTDYDLWGIPDREESELEDSFTRKDAHDGLWGVYRFKRGFGGEIRRSVGACDRVFHKGLYFLYKGYEKLRGGSGD